MRRNLLSVVALAVIAAAPLVPARADDPPTYLVGAATREIHPDAQGSPLEPGTAVQKGGSGLGDGSVIPADVVGPGGAAAFEGERIAARALVIDDGENAIAMATVETQGMFAAYQRGIPGLRDIALMVQEATGGALPADNVVISNDHTHSGPDLIGAWGFVPDEYATFISHQTRDAIIDAFDNRTEAFLTAGADYAPDIIYNQTCTEALNQDQEATFPNDVCSPFAEDKDAWVRVLQATDAATGETLATMLTFAAHATLGGGSGLHGDWPQFVSDALAERYGGVGLAFQGAVGRTQPCRPRCGYTDRSRPGTNLEGRRDVYTTFLMYHAERALLGAPPVAGPIAAAKTFIRHEVTNPILFALVQSGGTVGAPIARSLDAPWVIGNTVLMPTSALRVGDQLILGAPGEAYPVIPDGVAEATNLPDQRVWTLGLADDQLGYLMAPTEAYPPILAQSPVNDNPLFNISPTVGDHVMCAQIRMANDVGFATPEFRAPPRCVAFDAFDAAMDGLGLSSPEG